MISIYFSGYTQNSVMKYNISISYLVLYHIIRLIPQGTVDNNLGPDRLAGPKALDPNYCRQPTLWLHDLCLKVLTVHGTELRLFWVKAFPLLILFMSRIWHSSSRYNFTSLAMTRFGPRIEPNPLLIVLCCSMVLRKVLLI